MKPTRKPIQSCPLPNCQAALGRVPHRVIKHSALHIKAGRRRRHRCLVCRRTFVATTGTAYWRMRKPRADFDRAVTMLSEGMSKAAIARVLGVSPSTISRWLQRGGAHVERFHDRQARLPDAVEVQMDELSTGGVGKAKSAWAYSAVEVWSRFWAALHVGNRTLSNTFRFTRKVRDAVEGVHAGDSARRRTLAPSEVQPLLVTSDRFKYYRPAMRRAFRHHSVAYVQVENTYARGRIARSESTLVLGSQDLLDRAVEQRGLEAPEHLVHRAHQPAQAHVLLDAAPP